ncbi:MAG: carbonic anhydrase family protein, partial [Thermoanaerobaculia bacterium]
TYTLEQFHFHEPSEHRRNGAGRAMELHFVHADEAGTLAVVGVLLRQAHGRPNPTIQRLWKRVPEEPRKRAKIKLRPSLLLPADRGYYRYDGSLTTPPCTEGVRWHVLRGEITVSPAQVAAYRHPDSARAVQPLNGRTVRVSR